jgi:hypothetical protein
VTQLRQKMLEELQRRNYSHRTAKTYLRIVRDFAKYFHRSRISSGRNRSGSIRRTCFRRGS